MTHQAYYADLKPGMKIKRYDIYYTIDSRTAIIGADMYVYARNHIGELHFWTTLANNSVTVIEE